MQRICLTMIVRNEAHVIGRLLASVKPYITHWAIVDTGSTDGTQELIRRELGPFPGRLELEHWVDFSTNRNQALTLARKLGADYAFVIDADEELVRFDNGAAWGPFEADAYAIRLRLTGTDNVWCRRQLFKLSCDWHYEDEIHERSVSSNAKTTGNILGFEIVSHNDSARNRDGAQAKAKRDAKTLRRLLKQRPDDPRLVYYLAQTLMTAGEIDRAIELHEKRLTLGGFGEEIYVSAAQIAALKEFRGDHVDDVIAAYQRAYELRPTRAEPLWAIAALLNDRGKPALAEVYARASCRVPRPSDSLVVNESVYKYRCADELAGALARLGRLEEALPILKRLETFPELPPEELPRVKENLAFVEAGLAKAAE